MGKLDVTLSNLNLKNPLIPASGTFGYGFEFAQFFDLNILGSFSTKGTTLNARDGNKLPRIAECDGGMLNSVGLENPGVKKVVTDYFPKLKKIYNGKVFANVSGFSIDEYKTCASILDKEDMVGIIELNISCPNVHGGGMSFGVDIDSAVTVLKEVKKVCNKPVYVKCTPQCKDIVKMAKALETNGADGLVLLNTFLGMRFDIGTGKPILANLTGGVSGKGIYPLVLETIYKVYKEVNIPLVGCGGVSCASDVIEMMSAGASAVEIGTANLINPYACKEIIEELNVLLDKFKIDKISSSISLMIRNLF